MWDNMEWTKKFLFPKYEIIYLFIKRNYYWNKYQNDNENNQRILLLYANLITMCNTVEAFKYLCAGHREHCETFGSCGYKMK